MKCPTCSYQPVQKPTRHCPSCGTPWPQEGAGVAVSVSAKAEKGPARKTSSGNSKRNKK